MKKSVLGVFLVSAACGGEEMMTPAMMEPIEMIEPTPMPHVEQGEGVDDGLEMEGIPVTPQADGPLGFIGSPCARNDDCSYDGAACLREGFPGGTCSLPCDRFCPDRAGHPVTFCPLAADLPGDDVSAFGDGACLSRCDFDAFPEVGCRIGYGCVPRNRANDNSVTQTVCVPGEETNLGSTCLDELARRGVDFTPTTRADAHPSTHPNLTCHIEDPVQLHSPVHGVTLHYYNGEPTPNVLGACNMILALVKTIDDVAERGVTKLRHYGSYNCRVISGTNTLSRHGYGDAIDIYGFEMADGTLYSVLDDYEQDDTTPETMGGIFLYQASHRWHDTRLWSIILTPNYNAAHRNHFHVDLTPGSNFLGLTGIGPGYIGPAPYDD